MRIGCVEHASDEGLGLGCRDGSSELEVGGGLRRMGRRGGNRQVGRWQRDRGVCRAEPANFGALCKISDMAWTFAASLSASRRR
jgi:hypothetical protein